MPTQQFWHSGPKDNFQLDEQFTSTSQLFLTDLTFQTESVRGQIRNVENTIYGSTDDDDDDDDDNVKITFLRVLPIYGICC